MSFVSHEYTARQIIERAAMLAGDPLTADGRDPETETRYYAALNEFLQSVARSRVRYWLVRQAAWFATVSGQQSYRLRQQARGSVTFSGGTTAGDTVTVGSEAYALAAATTTAAAAATALAAAINADADRPAAARASGAVCYVHWAGTDGVGQTLEATVDAGGVMSVSAFAYHLEDFSRLLSPPQIENYAALRRCWPQDRYGLAVETAGIPRGFAVDSATDGLVLYSSTYGPPDDIYLLRFGYVARPSAVLPDGRGSIDFPEEFHDILPHAVLLLVKAGRWDESVVFGDSWMARRLAELDSYGPDLTGLPETGSAAPWTSEPGGSFEVIPPLITG